MNRNPLVSVIIPTYNHAKYLRKAIDSVLKQTHKNYEIIVIDDGSNDNTKEVLAPYMNKIKYFYQENSGLAASRNAGIRASKGDYIQFLDADDTISPQKLDIQVMLLELHTEADVVACRYSLLNESSKILLEERRFANELVFFKDLVLNNPFAVNALLLRRDCFTSAGFFDESLKSSEDWDMWLRVTAQNHHILCHNQVLIQCYRHASSMRQNSSQMCDSRLRVLDKVFMNPDLNEEVKDFKKQAYINVFFNCSWGFYSSNRIKDGRKYFIKAIKINPSVLADFKTFYQFERLFKPFGYRDIPIDFKKSEYIRKEIFSILDELYYKTTLPHSIKRLKKRAYSNAYFGIALRYYEFKEIKKFVIYLITAFRLYPRLVLESSSIHTGLKVLSETTLAKQQVVMRTRAEAK